MRSMKMLSLAVTLVLGWPQQRYENANLIFTPAYLRSGDVEFDTPLDVDWEALARNHYGSAKLTNPDRDEIRRRWSEVTGATFEFDASLPPLFKSGTFYLIAESGSGFLEPTQLKGTVTYQSDEAATQISAPTFYGTVLTAVNPRPADAGFIVYSPVRRTVTKIEGLRNRTQEPRLSVRQEGNENIFTLTDRGKMIVVGRKPAKYPVLQSATLFRFGQGDTAYLAIRWVPDKDCIEACCEHAYSLYRISDVAELVLENFYDCDV